MLDDGRTNMAPFFFSFANDKSPDDHREANSSSIRQFLRPLVCFHKYERILFADEKRDKRIWEHRSSEWQRCCCSFRKIMIDETRRRRRRKKTTQNSSKVHRSTQIDLDDVRINRRTTTGSFVIRPLTDGRRVERGGELRQQHLNVDDIDRLCCFALILFDL